MELYKRDPEKFPSRETHILYWRDTALQHPFISSPLKKKNSLLGQILKLSRN